MMTLMPLEVSRDLMADSGLSDPDYEVLSNLSENPDHEWRFGEMAAAPAHVVSARKNFIDLLTGEQLEVLGDVSEAVVGFLEAEGSR